MRAKLKQHLGEDVIITNINGKPNVVTFQTTANHILQEFHNSQERKECQENEALNIIKTAAKLIKNDIKHCSTCKEEFYPSVDTDVKCHLNFLPQSLKQLLLEIFTGKNDLKVASIGQAIMKAARPRVLNAPLQMGLAVQLHHNFASRFLVDSLYRFGFCSSYNEVQAHNMSAAVDQGTDIPDYNGEFVQYAADNVDHDLRTLDGHNTFHGMGMIATITPGTKRIRRVPKRKVTIDEITTAGRSSLRHQPSPEFP